MKTFLASYLRTAAAALAIAGIAASQAFAMPTMVPTPNVPASQNEIVLAQADCHAIGMREAGKAGGQLAKATPEVRNGQAVCVIVVLMPARDGQRPVRNEIVVPAG